MTQAELPADVDFEGHMAYLKFLIPKLPGYKKVLINEESRDVEEYVQICDKLKTWRLVYVNNCKLMHQLFDSLEADVSKGPVSVDAFKEGLDNIRAIMEQWAKHQKNYSGTTGHCRIVDEGKSAP